MIATRRGIGRWLCCALVAALVICRASEAVQHELNSSRRHLQASDPVTSAPALVPSTGPPTAAPFTPSPATESPATQPPRTEPPLTAPPTAPPATEPPTTQPPVTESPATHAPVPEPPVTEPPVTEPPATESPVTQAPVTELSATEAPATQPTVTEAPATQAPETLPPTSETPSTQSPATEAPSSEAPIATSVEPIETPPSVTPLPSSVSEPSASPPVDSASPSPVPSDQPTTEPSWTPEPTDTSEPTETPSETPSPTSTDTPATSVPPDQSESPAPPTAEVPRPTGTESPDPSTEAPTNAPAPSTSEPPSTSVPLPTSDEPSPSTPSDSNTPTATADFSIAPDTTPPLETESPATDVPANSEPPPVTQPPSSDVEPTQTPVTNAPPTQDPTAIPTPEPSVSDPPSTSLETPAPAPDVTNPSTSAPSEPDPTTETPAETPVKTEPLSTVEPPIATESSPPVTETPPPPVTETPTPLVTETPPPPVIETPPPPVTETPPPAVTDVPPNPPPSQSPLTDPPLSPPQPTETAEPNVPPPVVTDSPPLIAPITTDPPVPETSKPTGATEPPSPPASTPESPVVTVSNAPVPPDSVDITPTPSEPSSPTPVPTTVLPVIDVPIAVETNSPDVSAETLAKKDDRQNANSNSPSTPTPTSDDVYWQPTAEPEKYVRGQTPIDDLKDPWTEINGSHVDGNTSTHTQPLIIGGKQRGSGNVAGTPYSQAGTLTHDIVRYVASSVSAISVSLLLFFHVISLSPTLQWSKIAWSPNTWEFCVYVAYIQQMAAMSQMTLLKSPFFLWDFTDAFAWTNFLIQRTTGAVAAKRRLLETVIILDGIVGYADRIGLKESRILTHTLIGYLVVTGCCLITFGIAALVARHRKRRRGSTDASFKAWDVAYRLLGLYWLVWFFSLYPLSTMASFEIYMEIHSSLLTPELLLLSLFTLAVLCVLMLAIALREVWFRNEDELRDTRTIAIFGAFYADSRYPARMFFVLGALLQLSTGICIGVLDSTATLLSVLIAAHGVYSFAVLVIKPYSSKLVRCVTLAVEAFKIMNFSIAFAFLPDSKMPSKHRVAVANVFIGVNAVVLVVWFVRHLVIFAYCVKASLRRRDEIESNNLGSLESSIRQAKYEAGDTPSLQTTSASASRYPRHLCWSLSVSLSDSASMAWGHDTTPRTAYAPVMESR